MKALRFAILILITGFLATTACRKEPEQQAPVVLSEDSPVMSAINIDVLFSDSGRIQARLESPKMNRYAGEVPRLEFPNGFKVIIFDSLKGNVTTITGDRAERGEYSKIMEAWGNVVVRNEIKNEQLNTEHLIWDDARDRIESDVKVKITRPDQVITGSSLESNETFTMYSITNMSGEMNVKQDSI